MRTYTLVIEVPVPAHGGWETVLAPMAVSTDDAPWVLANAIADTQDLVEDGATFRVMLWEGDLTGPENGVLLDIDTVASTFRPKETA